MPFADGGRHQLRVVAHWEMIAFGHDDLTSIIEQLFPSWLKSKRIVALAENREQWQPSKWAAERAIQLLVDCLGFASVAQIAMERADASAPDACAKRLSAGCVEMKPNAEWARGHSRQDSRSTH